MPRSTTPPAELSTLKLYSRGKRVVTVLVWLVMALLLLNLALSGGWGWNNLKWASWPLAISWALYVLQYAPEMVLNDKGIKLVNVVTDITIPWNAVSDIRVRLNTEVHVGEKKYYSWGAPGLSRRPKMQPASNSALYGKKAPRVPSPDPTAVELDTFAARFQPLQPSAGTEAVKVSWNTLKIGVAVLLVAFCVISVVV